MSKYGHGDYIELLWEWGDPEYEAIRGHVSLDEACAILIEQGILMPSDLKLGTIHHTYARWIPASPASECTMILTRTDEQKQGAFPVTLWYDDGP